MAGDDVPSDPGLDAGERPQNILDDASAETQAEIAAETAAAAAEAAVAEAETPPRPEEA